MSQTLMILWRMLHRNFHRRNRSQAAVRRTVVGVRTPFHSPLSLSGVVNVTVTNMKVIVQMVTLADHTQSVRQSRTRLVSQAMSPKRQQQDQAMKNNPKKDVGCDGGLLLTEHQHQTRPGLSMRRKVFMKKRTASHLTTNNTIYDSKNVFKCLLCYWLTCFKANC